jgi:hypothetical protein
MKIEEMEIEAKKLEAQGDYAAAARMEFQIIQLKKENEHVS